MRKKYHQQRVQRAEDVAEGMSTAGDVLEAAAPVPGLGLATAATKGNKIWQAFKKLFSSKGDDAVETGVRTSGKFWKKSTNFKGVKVYQRDDIFKPNQMSSWKVNGKTIKGTNIQRMASGRAPIGVDGKSVNLHHMTQGNNSGIAEMTASFHQKNSAVMHINPSAVPSGINRSQFKTWKENYWKQR